MRLALIAMLALACSDPPPPDETPPPDLPAIPPEPDEPRALREPVAAPADLPPAPSSGCAFGPPVRVWDTASWSVIAPHDGRFIVAGSAHDGETERAFVVRVEADGTTQTIASGAIDPPLGADRRRAFPAIAVSRRIAIAMVFGDGRVRVAQIDPGAPSLSWNVAGEGASVRFSPAIAADREGWLTAWTDERATPRRVRAARIGGSTVSGAREILPAGGSASAPTFVANSSAPALMVLDAREGMSVAHRVAIRDGAFGDLTVARPINLAASPPEIAAVRIGEHEWIAYTAIGSAATSAIGLLRVGANDAPIPLVPGTGYGTLHVDVASLGNDRAIFIADAPQASAPTSPRELHVRVVDASGVAEPIVIRGPSGAASRGRIAYAGDGLVAVSFVEEGTFVTIGRCAE